jgi:hypothetical protein
LANNDGEQFERNPSSGVDAVLLHQVISLTREVNTNLGNFTVHTGRLIVRQNALIALCVVALSLLSAIAVYVYDFRQTQELISLQMDLIRYHMMDIDAGKKAIGSDLVQLRESMDALNLIIEDSACNPTK